MEWNGREGKEKGREGKEKGKGGKGKGRDGMGWLICHTEHIPKSAC